MTPAVFLDRVIGPGLALLPPAMDTPRARVMLLAIAGQESNWEQRLQVPSGIAHGYWQCEHDGGIAGTMQHPATKTLLAEACKAVDVPFYVDTLYAAVTYHDPLATVVARLILWADPAPLPLIGSITQSWDYYLRCWAPGKPDRTRWERVYLAAATVTAPPAG